MHAKKVIRSGGNAILSSAASRCDRIKAEEAFLLRVAGKDNLVLGELWLGREAVNGAM